MDEKQQLSRVIITNGLTGKEEHFVPYSKKRIPGVYAPDDLRINQHRFTSPFDWQNSATRKILYEKYPEVYSNRRTDKN